MTRRSTPHNSTAWLLNLVLGAILATFVASEPAAAQSEETETTTLGVREKLLENQTPASQVEVGAGDTLGTWSAGVRGFLASFSGGGLDSSAGVSGFAVYTFSTDLEFEIEAGLVRPQAQGDGLPEGRLTLIPVRGTVRVQLWRFGEARPYAAGGAGLYIAAFSIDDALADRLAQLGFDVAQTTESGVGLHAGGGVEWQRDRWMFGADVKYLAATVDASSRLIDTVTGLVISDSGDIDLNGFWISFGIRVRL